MPHLHVNYLAVLVSATIPILLGVIWYSPLMFHNLWVRAHGHSEEKVEQLRLAAGRSFLVAFFCYLVMAFVLAVLISLTGSSTIHEGVHIGLLVWIGFFATPGLTAHMFSEKRITTYLLDVSFQFVYIVAMAIVLTAWQ